MINKPLVQRMLTFLEGEDWIRISELRRLATRHAYQNNVIEDAIKELRNLAHVGIKFDRVELIKLYKETELTRQMQLAIDDF